MSRPQQIASLTMAIIILCYTLAWADCQRIYEQARDAFQQGDLAQLKTLYMQASNDASCDEQFRAVLGQHVAVISITTVMEGLKRGGDVDTLEGLLRDSLRYARLWQALAVLGDMYRDRKNYGSAAKYYQDALDIINDASTTPHAPDAQIIKSLFHKAEVSRLLADDYIPLPVRSTGRLAGTAALGFRGFVPKQRALPITFEFDSASFDRKGRQVATELFHMLQQQRPSAITLIGHTDERGSAEYNKSLSLRRAAAVKTYLLGQGYQGHIRVDGRGEEAPYVPDDRSKYTQEEFYRLCRRVELRFE